MFDEPYYDRMNEMPKIVFSSTIDQEPGWENSTVIDEDAVTAIERLKRTTDIPMRIARQHLAEPALLAAGLVDRLEVMVFPAITGKSGYAVALPRRRRVRPRPDRVDRARRPHAEARLRADSHSAIPEGVGPKPRTAD